MATTSAWGPPALVEALSDDAPVLDDDAADDGIRIRLAETARREPQGPAHPTGVFRQRS